MQNKITIGSDPELFLFDPKELMYRSSVGLVGGTKSNPIPMWGDKPGFFVQEDNVTVEFNTPPVTELADFVDGIKYSVQQIKNHAKRLGYEVRADASAYFSPTELLSDAARHFGCDPDMNAWTGKMNSRPCADNEELRSCGGHIHVGNIGEVHPRHLIQAMDLYLGVPSVVMDQDTDRKQLYGKAGACRIKPYGVEYRVLSNFWLKSEDLTRWAFIQTLRAYHAAAENKVNFKEEGDFIQYAINNTDVEAVELLNARHKLAILR